MRRMGVQEVEPMPGPYHRSGWIAFVACGLAGLLACAPGAPSPSSCATAAECPADARCVSGVCVANAPPSTVVALPAALESNILLPFDASASGDPDAGDSVASFAWSFRALSADACPAPVVAGTGPVAHVRFGCAGRYAVDVTATDGMGAASTATTEFDVAAHATLVDVGLDLIRGHVCTGTPRCTPDAPVALSASTPGIPSEQVSFAWTVEPPVDRPLASFRRVTFSPSSAVASPTVTIETDGEAISGDWTFHVEARDAAGVIGTAAMRVSVGNRPPRVVETLSAPNHHFDGSQFTAAGEVPFTVEDPDGDVLVDRTIEWRHTGDGSSGFSGVVLGAPPRVTFSIVVPYGSLDDASKLIGGTGLERTIVFGISDVNGLRTVESWPIVVANRPPVAGSAPSGVTVPHAYDAAAARYTAAAQLSTWTDPDGDPLRQAPGSDTGDPACPAFVVDGGIARVDCSLAYTGAPAVANFAGPHVVTQHVQDPWTEAATASTVSFTIGNRAPVITTTATFRALGCVPTGECCAETVEGLCESSEVSAPTVVFVPSRWSDPDGDPVSVQVAPAYEYTAVRPLVCASPDCLLELSNTEGFLCTPTTTSPLPMTISDGAASTSGTLPVKRC